MLLNVKSKPALSETRNNKIKVPKNVTRLLVGLCLAGISWYFGVPENSPKVAVVSKSSDNSELIQLISNHKTLSRVVAHKAVVHKILRDDNVSPRHQRWVIRLPEGQELTVVHNIDLAERVPLQVGDQLEVAGELVYGHQRDDPILHWTHYDPDRRRRGGYVELNGKKYGAPPN